MGCIQNATIIIYSAVQTERIDVLYHITVLSMDAIGTSLGMNWRCGCRHYEGCADTHAQLDIACCSLRAISALDM